MLELKDISRAFDGRQVLDRVSFDVEPGEFVSLIGPSGAGKSTLFNIIAGLDTPDSGQVRFDGTTAYMPQKDLLFPWRTIEANAALGLEVQGVPKKEARARAREWFPQFGLEGFEKALPFQLSGGMRQRAALLRTVVQEKSTLLLDEPFGALDSLTRSELQTWLQGMWAEHDWTAMLITHDVREAIMLSDRIVVLNPRPASVREIITVDLPRPRGTEVLSSPAFGELERRILEHLQRQ
ncbi:ABC transporter ATP-binding protein [Corynebacterium sp. p3-SID1145]|uniref:ABC transporter ATP-binding protein n=1 Tax=unclassified Corynebacterium TaxID=2624378 RepID=UPI0021AAA21E|nr:MULTISPECIES: ABC transporter ATP-binding protein [unclassified Corynebacterium]MCT1451758.1 ABC transporter ATP-binding protein [Corynebacterium sp. p3-SID1145]MCT1460855.1 ABC transporter ATP-binding protein [Corynebacterium sp. p3-SID1140]